MTNQEKKVPELRFPEFDGEWEEKNLEEVSNKVTEKNRSNELSETFTNSAEYGIISQQDYFDKTISNEKNLSNYYIVKKDDFVYNPRISNFAPVGPIKRNKLNRSGLMSPLYYVFRTFNIKMDYIGTYFETTYWHKFMKLNGDSGARSDRFAIKDSVFQTMPIPYPIIEEQEKIGEFFKKLDRQIELEKQKLAKLEEQKKGYMQKIFSQELRFKDENGNEYPKWEEKFIKNILEFENNRRKPVTSSLRENGEYPYYGATGIIDYVKDYIFDGETRLLIGEDGAKWGAYEKSSFIAKNKYWVNNHAHVCKSKTNNLEFLNYLLNFKELRTYVTGNAPAKLTYNNLCNILISIPSIDEQEKIGEFFKQMDNFIDKQSIKIEFLKERKQGLLQKMFI